MAATGCRCKGLVGNEKRKLRQVQCARQRACLRKSETDGISPRPDSGIRRIHLSTHVGQRHDHLPTGGNIVSADKALNFHKLGAIWCREFS
jgi:hypothetical protein